MAKSLLVLRECLHLSIGVAAENNQTYFPRVLHVDADEV